MPLPLKIALRFLFSSRREKPLLLFSIITVGGIAIAVCLFFTVDTLASGFSKRLREILIGFHAPVVIETSGTDLNPAKAFASLKARGDLKGVEHYSGHEMFGLLEDHAGEVTGVRVRGVDAGFFKIRPREVKIYWQDGFDETSFLKTNGAILLGEELYKNLPWPEDGQDLIKLINPFADLGPSGNLEPRLGQFVIAGFVVTGSYDIDRLYAFLPENTLARFGDASLMQHRTHLYPAHLNDTDTLIQKLLSAGILKKHIRTWASQNKNLFQAMALERIVFTVLFFFIMIISIINLVSVVRLFGLSKRHDMTVLRALGLGPREMLGVGLWLGGVLSTLGAFLGLALGTALLMGVKLSGFMMPEAYGYGDLPLEWRPLTVGLLLVFTPLAGALVSYWPLKNSFHKTVREEFSLS